MITMTEAEAKQQGMTHTFLGAYKDYGLVDWYKKQGYEVMTSDSVLPDELTEQWKTVQKEKSDNEVYLIKQL